MSYLHSIISVPFVEFGGRGGLDVQKQSCLMGRERGEQIRLHPQRHQICFQATMQTCTVSSMRMSVSSFIHHRSGKRGTKDPLDNIQPLPLYPALTSPLERGVEWPRRSVNTTSSRTSASLGVVLSGSSTRQAMASKWRYLLASSSIQNLLVRRLALLSLHSSFPNPHFSIWRTL